MSFALQGLHKSLVNESTTSNEYRTMAKQHGVSRLVTAAKTEALILKTVDKLLPAKGGWTVTESEQAIQTARIQHIGDKDKNPPKTRDTFIQDHREGKTVQVISGNLNKIAKVAKEEYFSGAKGFFRRIASIFHTSDTMKEIQGLRDLAAKNLEEIKQ
jgi:hypothetical protein